MANASKTLVEQCLPLDIKHIKDAKVGVYRYKNSRFDVYIARFDTYLKVGKQVIQLITQQVGYGERLMFECPTCFEARNKLYMKPERNPYFACRKCHNLVYRMSRLCRNDLEYIDKKY